MRILGIDPGLSGGCAIYDAATASIVDVIDIPVIDGGQFDGRVDCCAVGRFIFKHKPTDAFIERASGMPSIDSEKRRKMGGTSNFNYGRGVGYLEAAVLMCGVRATLLQSTQWKKVHGLSGTGAEAKNASRLLVIQKFPRLQELFARVKDHGKAEAVLIAIYGASKLAE